jgi:flagellar motor switch protein FliG
LLADIAPVSSPKLAEMLDWMEVDVLAALLDNEHPQVGALIVSSLSADLAAQALGKLDEGRQTDLLLRAARLGRVSVEAITELEDIVSRYVGDAAPPPKVELGGSSGVAKIMNSLGKPRGERLIKAIRKADKPIADAIEEGMFVFEDLLDLDNKALGTVMRSVDSSSLVFALKGAPKELVDRNFASMSQRAAQSIQDEMAEKTMVKRAEVDEAQKAVIAIARQLADAGEIVLGSSGNDYV